jgi:transcriptional regulator with XRE-family HTH domain
MQSLGGITDIPIGRRGVSYRTQLPPPRINHVAIFADRLRDRRNERGLSQREIAAALDINQSQYSHYEKGTMPNADLLKKMADLLECSTDYLLGASDDPGVVREFENLPEDEHNLVLIYREYKRGNHIPRVTIKMLRDLNIVEDGERPAVEGPKKRNVSGKKKAPNSKIK